MSLAWRLEVRHLGAQVTEELAAVGGGDGAGEVDDVDAVEGSAVAGLVTSGCWFLALHLRG